MDFTIMLDALRTNSASKEKYRIQIEEEKALLEREIEASFANKTYCFTWKGALSPTAVRSLREADCRLVSIYVGKTMEAPEFEGYKVYTN